MGWNADTSDPVTNPHTGKAMLPRALGEWFDDEQMRNWTFTDMLPPKGGRGCLMSSPLSGISGLSFDSTLLSPLLFFCLVLLPFLFYRFLPAGPFF